MSGTREGGLAASKTNKKLHGEDFYSKIGAKGGHKPCAPNAGFKNPELARRAGALGGFKSRRGKVARVPKQSPEPGWEQFGMEL